MLVLQDTRFSPIQLSTTAQSVDQRAQSVDLQPATYCHTTNLWKESNSRSRFTRRTSQSKPSSLNNCKLFQHDPTTAEIFSQPLLIVRCRTCPFISNANKILASKRTVTTTDHFTYISANLIFCITCTLGKKYTSAKRAADWVTHFREHLRDVEINVKDASKPVARHFNLPNHSQNHMAVCGLSLHLGSTESRKNEKNLSSKLAPLVPLFIPLI